MLHRLTRSPDTRLFPRAYYSTGHQHPVRSKWPPTKPIKQQIPHPLWRSINRNSLATDLPKIWNSPSLHNSMEFHSTSRNQGSPFIPIFAALLKSSASLEFARTAGRIALTFVPVILMKNYKSRKYLQSAEKLSLPGAEEKRPIILRRIRNRTLLYRALVLTPLVLFWATLVASLEKTPLTGRWRLILLSPEEEDQISDQLAGPGWYQAVSDILASQCENGKLPAVIPSNDWRYIWVESTLRRLESGIPILQDESSIVPNWLDIEASEIQLPPPAEHPLRPRPRASEYLRRIRDLTTGKASHASAHVVTGPPYSLLVVDKPDASNAFSYGFGPNGGGGLVLFSGFLDEITKGALSGSKQPTRALPEETSWWSHLFGFLSSSQPRPSHVIPTPEQTTQLAVLLAHELSHLVLSHHLESLSSTSIIVPAILSMVTDTVRALLFPITMLFGPFVNDAVANVGKIGSGEVTKLGALCSLSASRKQEIEADMVSTRLLAYAGFDPNSAVEFWENRQDTPEAAECGLTKTSVFSPTTEHSEAKQLLGSSVLKLFDGSSHPVNQVRVESLKEEMERWRTEKRLALARLQDEDVQLNEGNRANFLG